MNNRIVRLITALALCASLIASLGACGNRNAAGTSVGAPTAAPQENTEPTQTDLPSSETSPPTEAPTLTQADRVSALTGSLIYHSYNEICAEYRLLREAEGISGGITYISPDLPGIDLTFVPSLILCNRLDGLVSSFFIEPEMTEEKAKQIFGDENVEYGYAPESVNSYEGYQLTAHYQGIVYDFGTVSSQSEAHRSITIYSESERPYGETECEAPVPLSIDLNDYAGEWAESSSEYVLHVSCSGNDSIDILMTRADSTDPIINASFTIDAGNSAQISFDNYAGAGDLGLAGVTFESGMITIIAYYIDGSFEHYCGQFEFIRK
ncbi:MAG: hypothetical protein IJK23_02105 [Clostridia bacterium]|nr:hypothetical protein [Clostridia bacterium]